MSTHTATRAGTLLAALALGAGVAACGSSTAQGVATAPGAGATSAAVTSTAAATGTTRTTAINDATPSSGPLSKEPTNLPTGKAPARLEVKDLIKGTGPVALTGAQLAVNYVGALYANGKVFDASWKDTPGKGFQFQLGVHAVIPGWDKGLVGMKVGGRRELIIPAADAYGAQGQGSTIPPNSALVFVVDLLGVGKG